MSYLVFTAEYLGSPNHVAIYVQTKEDGTEGQLYHVVGSIVAGMVYQSRKSKPPNESATYVPDSNKKIGTIAASDLAKFEELCQTVAPPERQVLLNNKKIDPAKPLRRCGEWVQEVLEEAIKEGLIQPQGQPF